MEKEQLNLLKEQLADAKLGKAILFSTPDDRAALFLAIDDYIYGEGKDNAYFELLIEIFDAIESNEKRICEECDWEFHTRQQTSFPMGKLKSLSKGQLNGAINLYFSIAIKHLEELKIATRRTHTADLPVIIETIFNELVLGLYSSNNNPLLFAWLGQMKEKGLNEKEILTALKTYLSGEELDVTALNTFQNIIAGHSTEDILKMGGSELNLYKYAFGPNKGFFRALKSPLESTFGLSKEDSSNHLVIPWFNAIPQEGSQFEEVHQTLLKTCQYYLHEWTNPNNTRLFIDRAVVILQDAILLESYPDLPEALKYYGVIGNGNHPNYQEITQKIHLDLTSSYPSKYYSCLLRFFLAEIIFPHELKVYMSQLNSPSRVMMKMGHRWVGLSATTEGLSPYFDEIAFKIDTTMLPKVFEKAVNEATEAIGCDEFKSTWDIVTAVLEKMKEKTTCIIDVDGLFRGIPGIEVAKKIFEKGANFHGVLFYSERTAGIFELRLLFKKEGIYSDFPVEDSSRKGLLLLLNQLHLFHGDLTSETYEVLFERLKLATYYDQGHTRGSDIPQKADAHGLLLYDDLSTETDIQQRIMRERLYLDGQSITWIYLTSVSIHKPLPAGQLIAQSKNRKEKVERVCQAQAILDRIAYEAHHFLHCFARKSRSLDQTRILGEILEPLIVENTMDAEDFNLAPVKKMTFLDKIDHRLEIFQQVIDKLNEYPSVEVLKSIYSKLSDLRDDLSALLARTTLEMDDHEGIQVQEIDQETQQMQKIDSSSVVSSSYEYRAAPDSPIIASLDVDKKITNFRIPVGLYLTNKNILSPRFFISPELALSAKKMPGDPIISYLLPSKG